MPQYNVLSPLRHNGEIFLPGAVVEMTQQQAAALLWAAAIEEKSVSKKEITLVSEDPKQAVETDINKAIRGLDVKDQSLWLKNGRPRTETLAAIVGRRVSANERDQIWQQWMEENSP
ncbi:MAG: hypothetical protein HQL68_05560 [Magnetococcales bacterium]|nr:hypothetical protein [Magnetococcales bacterium]